MSVDDDVTGTELGLFRGFQFQPGTTHLLLSRSALYQPLWKEKK